MELDKISEYFCSLSSEAKARYSAKVSGVGLDHDPYAIPTDLWVAEPDQIPDVAWSDMFVYMIARPSEYTKEEMKSWKGMLGGDSFVKAGWVHGLKARIFKHPSGDRWLVMGKVKHSQRMTASPLLPWIVCQHTGEILTAHCTCMAGLGEACSHVAAVISCLIKASQIRSRSGADACTSQKCSWLPTAKDVEPADIRDINFSTKRSCGPRKSRQISSPTEDEIKIFFETVNSSKEKPIHHM